MINYIWKTLLLIKKFDCILNSFVKYIYSEHLLIIWSFLNILYQVNKILFCTLPSHTKYLIKNKFIFN